ncbi:bromodomain adjacent to zinc finger domain protein 2B-like [Daphnia carinata]|uniref:bromodomain adjacent to zinc finger domain protein 2B-like n=1 Tax=Daphnia carinata TaxID=120202 RepID=UPI00257B6EF2|nr:bromodomain adjacent to zinc finger domain protein 2B-like [Daphnia carinata]
MDSASDRDAKASNGGGDRGTPNHHGSSSSAMSVQQAQHVQAQAAAMNALGLLDPSALFAHSLFAAGIPASYNPMAPMPGYGLLGQGGPSPFAPPSSSNQANHAAAQAAWWSVASQMDYLARLQHAAASASAGSSSGRSGGGASSSSAAPSSTFHGIAGFSGMSAADSMLASYTMAMNAAAHSGGKSAKSSSSSRTSNPIVRDSLSRQPIPSASTASPYQPANSTSTPSTSKSRLPAGTELKFMTPTSAATTSGATNRKSSSSSKSRRRATTANNVEPASVSTSSTTTPSSSLSSLSSMAMSYPFFGNPLASLAMPPAMAAAVQSVQSAQPSSSSPAGEKRSSRKTTDRHSADSAQLLHLPPTTSTSVTVTTTSSINNNTINNGTKARSQTVNGKPLALDVSSLIGKPSTSTSEEAPLNLSMKTKEESTQPSSSASLSSTSSSRLGRGVSMPKKNTVASLLAQSRNQRSTSPGAGSAAPQAHAASNATSSQASAAEMKAMKDNLALYTAMQELSNAKLSSAYLNGLKDSLNSGGQAGGSDANHAIQDLLRAASLLGGFGFGANPLSGLSQNAATSNPSGKSSSSTPNKSADGGTSNSASKNNEQSRSKDTPTPENGQARTSESHRGNGKSNTHDDEPASDDSDSMDEDDSMIDSDDGWAGTGEGDESRKRNAEGGEGDDRPSKRRRFVSDEAALRIPLTQGWKRETLIRSIGKSGVRGEVTYYSPSGRRFRQYPDVVRYLERQGIGTITRDNFSFSTRCIVGEFIQPLGESPNARGIRLGEPEVRHLVDQIRIARGWKPRSRRMTEEEKEAITRQREAQRVAQRMEAQEMARQAQEAKLQQRMERERALQEAKEARRQMREQEKLERQEAQRRERELRTQQLMEARKKRQEELDRLREEEQQRKIQELNKQRELFYTAELERERKRQHTAVVKALEARKRYEERERRREEMKAEKRAEREKKMEERRKELETWRDQRSPTEDTSLMDHKPLPDVPRVNNLKLAGQAFADILMLYEFLHTFGETLGFDMESLPSLDSLQRALLYDSEAEEELLSVMTHLLVCAIEDPGIPHPNRHTTLLGQTLKQADITTTNVSEILRIYLQANGLGDMKMPAADKISSSPLKIAAGEYPDTEAFLMSEWLKRKPFLSLNPTQKAAILGFMVNELLQNKAVIGQIDGAIEGQNTARRDRWIVDSKIKKLKTLHSKKHRTSLVSSSINYSSTPTCKTDAMDDSTTHDETNHSATGGKKKDETEEHPEEAEEDSGAEADDNADQGDEDEDGNLPAEELKRKIERLSRQSAQMLTQLALSDLQLRALNMGQDRFRRRLWILPHAGGVYLEALESGEANAGPLGTWDGKPVPPIGPQLNGDEPMSEVPEAKSEQISHEQKSDPDEQKSEMKSAEPMDEDQPTIKTESSEEIAPIKSEENGEAPGTDPKKEDVQEALPALWFSLFPRNPCDRSSSANLGKDNFGSDAEEQNDGRIKKEETAKDEAEKIIMQPIPEEMTRGWWRIVDPEQVKTYVESLHPRGVREKELNRMLTRFMDFARESCLKHTERDHHGHGNPKDLLLKELRNADEVKLIGGAALPDAEGSWSRETSLRGDILLLEQIEALEDRVASASMQIKGWKLPPRATAEMDLKFRTPGDSSSDDDEDERINPIYLAKERLLSVELAIERRYLKAPLGQSKGDLVQSVLSGSCPSNEPPKALLTWREAVKRCETAAQVSMCFYVLETSVAWDKSIMKASCQFCHSGDKEDQLLLCDGCDKGYHTYCFRPPMDNIPDGDWFCYECRNKATGQRNCIVCGKPGNKTISALCDQCPKAYHIECLQPPLAKVPRGKWLCVLCHSKSPAKKKSASKKNREPRVSESECSTTTSSTKEAKEIEKNVHSNDSEASSGAMGGPGPSATPPVATPSPRRSSSAVALKRSLNQAIAKEKDLAPCREILDQLEAHEEAWPFLLPVNTKQFPTYKKIIRSPMDLSTIRKKLNDGIYKTRDDFCADLQLMFVNCVTFNEDDSPVGKAGHSMKTFFDSRWAELIAH